MPREFVRGARELDRALRGLDRKIRRKVLLSGLRAVATPIKQDMARRAPHRTGSGQLRESIIVRTSPRRQSQHEAEVRIGPARSAFYGMFFEYGTRFMPARPFMRPAFDTNVRGTFSRFGQFVGRTIEREARKLNRGRNR